jgi:hypothetical protein
MAGENTFTRLAKIFRGGPIIKRRVAAPNTPKTTPFGAAAYDKFVRQSRELISYANFVNYQAVDRWSRYSDFSEMESRGEIAAALQVYADETCSATDTGDIIRIRSDNRNIKALLDTLFYDTLQVEFNLPLWVRTLCKYGDFALFNDIDPNYGILGCYPIPISDFQRIEGLNPAAPMDVTFLVANESTTNQYGFQFQNFQKNMQVELSTMGYNSASTRGLFNDAGMGVAGGVQLMDWQVEHFRLMGNDIFLPYGTSILDPARRLWRLLYMTEDLMLMYRAYRASDRRVLYVDTRGIAGDEIENYMQQAGTAFKREPAVVPDKSGGINYVFNPMSMSDDYVIPVRGADSGTRIETLAGGTNAAHIEDVEYLHKQMFACLNMPPAYLGYGEGAESFMGENLSQIHIRFARNIQRIQRVVLSQVNKMAMIHLSCHGFEGDELLNFSLEMATPSNVAKMQYLSGLETKASVASSLLGIEGLVGMPWIRRNVFNWDKGECDDAVNSIIEDAMEKAMLAKRLGGEPEVADGGGGGFDFENFSRMDQRNGELLTEEGDDESIFDEFLFEPEDERIERLNRTGSTEPYPRVSKKAKWGSTGMTTDRDNFVSVRPATSLPSPSSDADWELDDIEDILELGEFDQNPVKPTGRVQTPTKSGAVSISTSKDAQMRSKRTTPASPSKPKSIAQVRKEWRQRNRTT